MSEIELLKDFKRLRKQRFFFDEGKAVVNFESGDITDIKMSLLPTYGFFRDCLVRFRLKFSQYPNNQPKVSCLTRVFHPNISSSGAICFSLFGSHWSKDFRLVEIADALLFFLCKPNPGDALNTDCRFDDDKLYEKFVQQASTGATVGGEKYDRCRVEKKVKDSQHLAKELDFLLYMFDKEKMVAELGRKIGKYYTDKVEPSWKFNAGYQCLFNGRKKLNEMYNELNNMKSHNMNREVFNREKKLVSEANRFLRRLERAYEIEVKFFDICTRIKGLFFKKKSSSSFLDVVVSQNGKRVQTRFQASFPIFREAMGEFYSLPPHVESKEEKGLGDLIEKKLLRGFSDILEEESKFRSYILRVLSRLVHEKKSTVQPSFFENFESNEFRILTEKLDSLYDDLKYKFENAESEVESQKRLDEGIKLVEYLFRNCDTVLELEVELSKCTDLIETPVMEDQTILRMYIDQGICTFKKTGKIGNSQNWYRCFYCSVQCNMCCEVCKVNCHEGHSTSSIRRSEFWCNCGAGGECKAMEKEFDERQMNSLIEGRKTRFLEGRLRIREKLDELHSKVSEAGEVVREFEKVIKGLFSDSLGFK